MPFKSRSLIISGIIVSGISSSIISYSSGRSNNTTKSIPQLERKEEKVIIKKQEIKKEIVDKKKDESQKHKSGEEGSYAFVDKSGKGMCKKGYGRTDENDAARLYRSCNKPTQYTPTGEKRFELGMQGNGNILRVNPGNYYEPTKELNGFSRVSDGIFRRELQLGGNSTTIVPKECTILEQNKETGLERGHCISTRNSH